MKSVFLFVIRAYKRTLSPFLGNHCRYYPTCSDYMAQAVEKFGLTKGLVIGLKRLGRCHPFHRGGVDPIP